jgi:hypothetical protein
MTAVASLTDTAYTPAGRLALGLQQVGAVDHVEREDRHVGRDGRQAEAQQRRHAAGGRPDPVAQAPPQAEQHERRGDVVARHVAAGARVEDDDEHEGQRDGQQHVEQRGHEVLAPALLDAQQRVGDLEVRERPQAEQAEAHEHDVALVEQQIRQRPGHRETASAATVVRTRTVPVVVRATRRRRSGSSSSNQKRTNASPRPSRSGIDARMRNVSRVSATP